MQKLLTNPRELEDFLNREIEALDRLVDKALARNPIKKPARRARVNEMELAARA